MVLGTRQYFNPVRSLFGRGALASLSELVGTRRVVLVTFPEARMLGLHGRVETLLGGRLRGVIDSVQPNPDIHVLAPIYERHWRESNDAELLVALGGGSVIDTAKVLMVGASGGRFEELQAALENNHTFRPARVQALIAIPTTAGTGSEVTPWATVWDQRQQRKHSLHLDQTWPEAAIVDPELMHTLPAVVTLQSGLDALSHALEAIWNLNANPISDTLASAAAKEVLAVLPELMARPTLELRTRMALAALRAGLAFSNTRTALAHAISYEMTLRHGLAHGIACSFTLPLVLAHAIGRGADRDRVLADVLGPLDQACARLRDFLEGLGVKTRFADYGVSTEQARAMLAAASQGARGRNFIGAALPVSP